MFNFDDWLKEMNRLLDDMRQLDLGYPQGENSIAAPGEPTAVDELAKAASISPDTQLVQFYKLCNGVSLPDIHTGYFIHSAERVLSGLQNGVPTKMLRDSSEEAILVFGSNGGGEMFVLKISKGEVYYLPTGRVSDSRYEGSPSGIQCIAPDFHGFLVWLMDKTRKFVMEH